MNRSGAGLVATFDGPARGIRCAMAIRAALGSRGLDVRAGLHAGECDRCRSSISSTRSTSQHGSPPWRPAGEVLVSRTVSDLIAGSRIELLDRGEHELSGVTGSWRVYGVDATPSPAASSTTMLWRPEEHRTAYGSKIGTRALRATLSRRSSPTPKRPPRTGCGRTIRWTRSPRRSGSARCTWAARGSCGDSPLGSRLDLLTAIAATSSISHCPRGGGGRASSEPAGGRDRRPGGSPQAGRAGRRRAPPERAGARKSRV